MTGIGLQGDVSFVLNTMDQDVIKMGRVEPVGFIGHEECIVGR